ncbi:hypothetical protein [Streptomyces flaveolus]|uniref:hypothetical protein n=1 Tax=Streptomyces flaveolus TaxID=67297 RepID=UPI0036FA505D
MSTTNLVTLVVALIALIGTVISAILGPLYAQRARREDRLRTARDRFQDDCDGLEIIFASVVVRVFSYRNQHRAWVDDYADVPPRENQQVGEEESWYAVHTALKGVERAARKIAQENEELGRRAWAVHESLQKEVDLVRGASSALEDSRDPLHSHWLEIRARSDRLRKEFDAAASRA